MIGRWWVVIAVLAACGDDSGDSSGMALERLNVGAQTIVDMDVAADGTIYVLSRGSSGPIDMGVSRDRGVSWELRTTNGVQVSDIEVIGNSMLVVSDAGLVRYADITQDVWGGEVYPSTFGQTIYNLHEGMSLYQGTNGRVFAFRHWFGAAKIYQSDQLYHSIDAGATWTNIPNPHRLDIIGIGADGHLYGGNPSKQVYRSTDFGASWTLLGTFPVAAARLYATSTGGVYVFGGNGECRYAPDGTTFAVVPVCAEFESGGEVYAFRQALISGDISTIWHSRDGFATHDEIRVPLGASLRGSYLAHGSEIYVNAREPMYFTGAAADGLHALNAMNYSLSLFIDATGHYWAESQGGVLVHDPASAVSTYMIDFPSPPVAQLRTGTLVGRGFTSSDRGKTVVPMGDPGIGTSDSDQVRLAVGANDEIHVSVAHFSAIAGNLIWTHTERAISSDVGLTWRPAGINVLVTYIHPRTGELFGLQNDPLFSKNRVRSTDGETWTPAERILVDYDAERDVELWEGGIGPTLHWRLVPPSGAQRRLVFDIKEGGALSVQLDHGHLVVNVNGNLERTIDAY